MTHKYLAKVVFWDSQRLCTIPKEEADSLREPKRKRLPPHIYRFDSSLEFKVYLQLLKLYKPRRIKRQVAVRLIPPGICHPKGKTWRCDFAITHPCDDTKIIKYVEAKGKITPEFRNHLPILEHTNPSVFRSLIIVFGSRIPKDNRVIANLLNQQKQCQILNLRTFADQMMNVCNQ